MRVVLCIALLAVLACSSEEHRSVRLEEGEPVRLEGCNLIAVRIYADLVMMQSSCEAPESALDSEHWWGAGMEPLSFSIGPGDCIPLNETYYCLAKTQPPTLRATYVMPRSSGILRTVDRTAED